MVRTIECAVLLLMLPVSACQSTDGSADASSAAAIATGGNAAVASPLNGAWRLVAIQNVAPDGGTTDGTPQESFFLFTDDYYSMGYSYHEAPSPAFAAPWDPTESELQDRLTSLVVNAGGYELTGSVLVLRPEFALWPVVINSEAKIEYALSGDTLTLMYVDHVAADGVADPYYAGGAEYLLRLQRVR